MYIILIRGIEQENTSLERYSFREYVNKIADNPILIKEREGILFGEEIKEYEYAVNSEGNYREARAQIEKIIHRALKTEEASRLTSEFRVSLELKEMLFESVVERVDLWLPASAQKYRSSGYEERKAQKQTQPVFAEIEKETA